MKTNALTPDAANASSDFRLFLQAELARRCARNSQYSLRAFAKYLDIDHASLSQLLRGRRRLTARNIDRLGQRLGLKREAITAYAANERLTQKHRRASTTLQKIRQLTHDTASLISDWYHYAILELMRLEEFKTDSRWIARVLGISPDEANIALTRLIRLGILEMVSRDQWIDRSGNTTATLDEFTHLTIEKLSEQSRDLLLDALELIPPGFRDHSTTTMAICSARVPAVIELIGRFRRELIELLEGDLTLDDVYQLEISLFPITQLKNYKEKRRGTTRDAMADPGQTPG